MALWNYGGPLARKTGPADGAATELTMPLDDAVGALGERIDVGNRILAKLASGAGFKESQREYYTWDEYNYTLLERMFTTDELAARFVGSVSAGTNRRTRSNRTSIVAFGDWRASACASLYSSRAQSFVLYRPRPSSEQPQPPGTPAQCSSSMAEMSGRGESCSLSFDRSRALEWSAAVAATGKATPYVGEILDCAFAQARAVIVLFTPDDEAQLRTHLRGDHESGYELTLTPQPRANVLFEAGMAMGIRPTQTIIVEMGKLRPFTDVLGRHVVRLDNTLPRRQELCNRLTTAGCEVSLVGTDWHHVGELTCTPNP